MRILVISAHPDDEVSGCAGTLIKHRMQGDEIHWCIVTTVYTPMWSEQEVFEKAREVETVAKAYGVTSLNRLGFRSTTLDTLSLSEIIESLREVVDQVAPDIVYVVHYGDVHSDHRIVFEATTACLKPFRVGKDIRGIYTYETSSSTEQSPPIPGVGFFPTAFCDITETIEQKLEIAAMYKTEYHEAPHPRSVAALKTRASFRGSTLGILYAEAFVTIREILLV